jgi:hypothetical protein
MYIVQKFAIWGMENPIRKTLRTIKNLRQIFCKNPKKHFYQKIIIETFPPSNKQIREKKQRPY